MPMPPLSRSREGGANIRVRIDCLRIVENVAWASGVVVDAIDPNNIGRPHSYKFIDNGEGGEAVPDEYGAARFLDLDCMTEPDITTRPILIGDLQIRD